MLDHPVAYTFTVRNVFDRCIIFKKVFTMQKSYLKYLSVFIGSGSLKVLT